MTGLAGDFFCINCIWNCWRNQSVWCEERRWWAHRVIPAKASRPHRHLLCRASVCHLNTARYIDSGCGQGKIIPSESGKQLFVTKFDHWICFLICLHETWAGAYSYSSRHFLKTSSKLVNLSSECRMGHRHWLCMEFPVNSVNTPWLAHPSRKQSLLERHI